MSVGRKVLFFNSPRLYIQGDFDYKTSKIKVYAVRALNAIVRTLREDQPMRLLLNLLFYHFNRSEPTYKSERINGSQM